MKEAPQKPSRRSVRPYDPEHFKKALSGEDEGISRDQEFQRFFMHIIKHGLDQPKKKAKVVVVGAGISGLCAARELLRAGYEVKILESSQRAGGRIFSAHDAFSDGLWGEAGAMRIPPVHYLVHAYATLLDVPMEKFNNSTDEAYYYFDEPDIPQKLVKQTDKAALNDLYDYWSEVLDVSRASLPISNKFNETMAALKIEIEDIGYPAVVAKYDQYSFRAFLQLKGWTEDEILLYSLTSTSEAYMDIGSVENFAEFEGLFWDDNSTYPNPLDPRKTITGLMEFTGGMQKFPDAFVEDTVNGTRIGDCIRYGSAVYKVNLQPNDDDQVAVYYHNETVDAVEYADYVVMAVPFGVMRNIETVPEGWSIGKQKAIREIAYAPSGKIFLQYSKQWWLDDPYHMPEAGGGGAMTSLPIRQVYFPSKGHSDFAGTKRGVIIASYTWEQDALVWGAMAPEDMVQRALAQVETIFPGTSQYFEMGFPWMWHLDPNTGGGAFAQFLPQQWTRLYKDVWKCDGIEGDPRFFFAGEHASPIHSWIEGALDAALWSVFELNERHQARSGQS